MACRIGAVSYLNTKPLIHGIPAACDDWSLYLDLPSRLADLLAADALDVALIPSVEYLRGNSWSIVSDACIACRGEVRSVRLLFQTRPDQVRTLALDEGSRTSAALSQVLLYQAFGIQPEVVSLDIDADYQSNHCDAILIIGDRAMNVDTDRYYTTWDLGEHWNRLTGLPFVFAMWVARPQPSDAGVAELLEASRDRGIQDLYAIAAREASRYGLSVEDCMLYFSKQLHFYLGTRELAGLDLFRRQAAELGLLPENALELSLQPS